MNELIGRFYDHPHKLETYEKNLPQYILWFLCSIETVGTAILLLNTHLQDEEIMFAQEVLSVQFENNEVVMELEEVW
jgi:hypothetical protein